VGLRWKEVHLKCTRGRLFVSIVFELDYRPYASRGLMALDVNLRKVATFDGCDTRRYETEFLKALSKRARAEGLQKKYPKRWGTARPPQPCKTPHLQACSTQPTKPRRWSSRRLLKRPRGTVARLSRLSRGPSPTTA